MTGDALPYRLDPPLGGRKALGLIVLQTDETLEHEFARLITAREAALFVSRVPSAPLVTPETLAEMAQALPRAASLLPPSLAYDVIGYGCTSASSVLGSDAVARQVRAGAEARAVTNPLDAVLAALTALNARRIGFLTPYAPDVSAALRAALEAGGVEIARFASFEEPEEHRVARIAPASTREAILALGAAPEVDAVFASCTNLRAVEIIAEAEAALGKPVISSNLALAWRMLRLAGVAGGLSAQAGRLAAV